jgi:proteasome lid subunit RPN8/RPN11
MGGLLIGHVDEQGRNVCVVGFFPEQVEASSGYCEFDGSWVALSAAAIDHANAAAEGPEGTPDLRVIGWIHTHPEIKIYLSGIDIKTYKENLNMTKDGRFVAVVVDPLRGKDGVFLSPDKPNSHHPASGKLSMDDSLKARYLAFLDRLEEIRDSRGRGALPFLLCGDLRREHVSNGNVDDYMESYLKGIHKVKRELKSRMDDSERVGARIDGLEVMIAYKEKSEGSVREEIRSMIQGVVARLDKLEQGFDDSIKSLAGMFEAKIFEMEGQLGDFQEDNDVEDDMGSALEYLEIHIKALECGDS